MITLNAICLNWAIQQERMKELAVTTASDRKQILSLLLGNMQMHYTYSECQLPDIILIDKLKNEITLSSIIADKRKLVLKFSPQNCYPCIEFSMSCLEKFALSIPNIKERLLIIISDANYREYQAISNSFIIRKTKCFDFWERNVLFPKTKRSFFRTPTPSTLPFSA